MKKLCFVLLLLLTLSLYAVEVQNGATAFRIIGRNSNSLDIEFNLPEYTIVKETVGKLDFQHIQMKGADYLAKEGMPELPVFGGVIAIPYHGSYQTEIISQETKQVEGFTPYPVQSQKDDIQQPVEFQMDQDYYQNGSFYPGKLTMTNDPAILRDFRVVSFAVHPFIYNASGKQLEVHNRVVVRFTFDNDPSINEMDAPTSYSTSFQPLYKSLLLNYNEVRDVSLPYQPERLMIIYANSTDATFLNKLNEFVNWKQQKGYITTLASTTQAGTSTSAIKTYIQNAYNNANTRPDYVILIGDASGTFSIPAWSFSWSLRYTGEGDYPYTHLAGGDLLGDVYIGRISISSTNDFLNIVAKEFAYERDMNLSTSQSWLNKMLLVGDTGSSGISTIYTNKYIKDISFAYNPSYTYSEVYSGGFSSSMNTAINSGIGFMNYRGYLGMSGWSPGSSLVNGNKNPHAVIITCGTGSFSSGTSATENFIRLGTASSPAGALTAIGMATTGTHTMLNNCLAGSIFEGLFTYDMHTMGQALLYGKIYLDKVYHAEDAELTQAFAHICNIMGDPTVEAFKGIPGTMRITTLSTAASGLNLIDIHVTEDADILSSGAHVTITQGANLLYNGISDEQGNVTAELPANWTGSLTITASKPGHIPFVETVNQDNNGSFIFQAVTLDDDNNGASSGNGNSIANGGESIELTASIKNTFSAEETGIYGILQCEDPYITIQNDSTTFGTIASNSIGANTQSLVFSISHACPDTYRIRFNLAIHNSLENVYIVPFYVTVRNADLDVISVQVIDGGNQILEAGDNATLNLTLINSGTMEASNLFATLTSLSSLVSVNDSLAYFGNIAPGSSANCIVNPFAIFGRLQLVPGMVIPFEITLSNNQGYSEVESFQITVGTVSSEDPFGPDTYGYYIYDITDVAYPDVPSYQWIGIAPAEGGTGTALALNDTGASNDEGDTTSAVSITTVNLPFGFSFYGQEYTQASICSNGFIALGSTQNGDFRNWHLPGALGPNPMIAVFWDDLCLINGGTVYTNYNAAEHYFVVEWYHTVNGYNRSSLETFEAILYDQDYYPTSMGDGQIKLQYQTFNNVDAGSFDGYTPSHGNYCTVGIKDHTGTRGLEYTFNNQYPAAASSLGNNKALLITGIPIFHQDPHLLLSETVLHNTNSSSSIEPGETADISIRLSNMGEATATGVSATIAVTDPYVTLIAPTSLYDPILGEDTGINKTYFRLSVSPTCPDEHTISVTINITAQGGFSWQRQTTLLVVKPQLELAQTLLNDHAGNGNGIANPGELLKLAVNLHNNGIVPVHNARVQLSCTNPDVTLLNSDHYFGDLPVDGYNQRNFSVQLSTEILQNAYVNIAYILTADNMIPINGQISIGIGVSGMSDDFEMNNGNFTAGGWSWGTSTLSDAHSGQRMWGTSLNSNYGNNQHLELLSPAVPIGSNATLTFWHKYGFETNYDGGNIMLSSDNGTVFNLVTPNGGYPHQSVPALGNQPGYTGSMSTWTQVVVSLNQFAGNSVRIKWNFQSDNTLVNIGWFIDDVAISGFMQSAGTLSGTVTLPEGLVHPERAIVYGGSYTTNPDATGYYELLLPNGTYNVRASMQSCQDMQPQSVVFADDEIAHTVNFSFNYLRPISRIFYTVASQIASMRWNAPIAGANHINHFNIYRQIDTDIFRKILETPDTIFVDTLEVNGNYSYYISVIYDEGESSPSDTISFNSLVTDTNDQPVQPVLTKLYRNYPNPFNPETRIQFALSEQGAVKLVVFNIKGQVVKTIVNEKLSPGNYTFIWNGKNELNRPVASGVYFFRLQAPHYQGINKAILLK